MISSVRQGKFFYGWVIVAVLSLTGTMIWGMRFSFGVFFKSLETEFGLNRTATSAIFSVYVILSALFATATGWAVDRFTPKRIIFLMGLLTGLSLTLTSFTGELWQVFVTYSVLLAMGTGMVYVLITSIMSRWFHRKLGLAMGIAGSGSGLGMLLIPPLATWLIAEYDWRTAYLTMGILTWAITLSILGFVKQDPSEVGSLPDGMPREEPGNPGPPEGRRAPYLPGLSLEQVLRSRSFWFLALHEIFCAYSQFFVLTHLVPHATDVGISAGEAALLLGLIGGAGIPGRIVMGIASDRLGRKGTVLFCSLIMALALLSLTQSAAPFAFYAFAVAYGFAFGGRTSGMPALVLDTFGRRPFGKTIGLLEASWGVGAAVGPALGGLIFDMTGGYGTAFLIATVTMFISSSMVLPLSGRAGR
ncbi:MAG: MFS transporter [Deltaproteobacteria bacterium]|nr:MFS transporter [Deltaproteobacteria bacterium]